jgi:hypothetical protein
LSHPAAHRSYSVRIPRVPEYCFYGMRRDYGLTGETTEAQKGESSKPYLADLGLCPFNCSAKPVQVSGQLFLASSKIRGRDTSVVNLQQENPRHREVNSLSCPAHNY